MEQRDTPGLGAGITNRKFCSRIIISEQQIIQQNASAQATVDEDVGPHGCNCMSTPARRAHRSISSAH